MMLSFEHKEYLWLLLLLPILVFVYLFALKKKKNVFKKIGDAALVKELTAHYNPISFLQKFLMVLVAMALILLSMANLRVQQGSKKVSRNGIDIMIAIDVSKSMLAQDIKPNRLERAKQLLNKVIDKLNNDRIGIIIFAGRAYLQMPLTGDHSAAKMYLASATPDAVPTQGTVIADALKSCNASFNATDKKYKAVILISDGEDHDENAIEIAEKMAEEGVVINTVGIGSPEGSEIIDELTGEAKKDNEGNVVITKLNETTLAEIAKKGNGKYQFYNNADAVANSLYNELSSLDKRTVMDDSLVNYKSLFQYMLGLALLLLMGELFISELKKKKNTMKLATTLLLVLISQLAIAQTDKSNIKKGNEAYKKKDYETAIKKYSEVIQKDAKNAVAQNNLGSALYKSDKKEAATNAFDVAANTSVKPNEKSNALYNKGVTLQNDKKLAESITAYKEALKLNPANVDARHNLQIALKKQQQQKKEEEEKKKEKKDDKKKEEPKKDDKKEEQPKENKSNLSKKEAEQKLQALLQKEKDLQNKMNKTNAQSPNKPEKDW
jgi:tetratricopeptide (TPR) repeat protein